MIKRDPPEVGRMRRKAAELAEAVQKAKKAGQTEQVRVLETELNALRRSVKDYEDRTDPQAKRKG